MTVAAMSHSCVGTSGPEESLSRTYDSPSKRRMILSWHMRSKSSGTLPLPAIKPRRLGRSASGTLDVTTFAPGVLALPVLPCGSRGSLVTDLVLSNCLDPIMFEKIMQPTCCSDAGLQLPPTPASAPIGECRSWPNNDIDNLDVGHSQTYRQSHHQPLCVSPRPMRG